MGIRIAEQIVEYLQNGVAMNAVNMPSFSPGQYKAAAPIHRSCATAREFRGPLSNGNPALIRFTYFGKIVDMNTSPLRNAGLAGVLRGVQHRVPTRQCDADRG